MIASRTLNTVRGRMPGNPIPRGRGFQRPCFWTCLFVAKGAYLLIDLRQELYRKAAFFSGNGT